MNKLKTIFFTVLITAGLIIGGYSLLPDPATGGGVNVYNKCDTYSSTSATVGADISSTILTAYSNRAYARIQVVNSASSTISLSFDEGADAVVGEGITLNQYELGGATTTPYIEFGLNTDFPYVGAITGITNMGSTTLQITECRF